MLLDRCAQLILGKHDFIQLSKKNEDVKNTICEVFESKWIINNNKIRYKIVANRFLHHMVRYLVGTMIEISKKNKLKIKDFEAMIKGKDRKSIHRAPSKGLYLNKVYYA